MLTFTKTVSRLLIRTAQQIDIKLMHPSEKFRQNLFVNIYFIKDFDFLIHKSKHTKILVWSLGSTNEQEAQSS